MQTVVYEYITLPQNYLHIHRHLQNGKEKKKKLRESPGVGEGGEGGWLSVINVRRSVVTVVYA